MSWERGEPAKGSQEETGRFRMLSIKTNRVAQTASCHLLVNYKMMLVAMPTPPTGFCFYLLRRAAAA